MSAGFWLGVAVSVLNAALFYWMGKRAGREEAHREVKLNPYPNRDWP